MKRLVVSISTIFLVLILFNTSFSQSWNISSGPVFTRFVFTNSQGINPPFLKSGSGLQLSVVHEKLISKRFVGEVGLNFSQYNAVGDAQNIPFIYQTDFLGITAGAGPRIQLGSTVVLELKAHASVMQILQGNQFLQNHFNDLTQEYQFNQLKWLGGFSIQIEKEVGKNISLFSQYQRMDTLDFGVSTLNFIPTSLSFGLKLTAN